MLWLSYICGFIAVKKKEEGGSRGVKGVKGCQGGQGSLANFTNHHYGVVEKIQSIT